MSIYPLINIKKGSVTTLETVLRKEWKGKWRDCRFIKSFPPDVPIEKALMNFNNEIYFFIICGQPDESCKMLTGELAYPESESQISEYDRIQNLLKI